MSQKNKKPADTAKQFQPLDPALVPYMMVAFGPSSPPLSTYVFRGPKTWEGRGLWKEKNGTKEDFVNKIRKAGGIPRCVSFGEAGSWYALYERPSVDSKGKTRMKADDDGVGLEKQYPKLAKWLWESDMKVRNVDDLWVALGPARSFWAWHVDKGIIHQDCTDLVKQMGDQQGARPRVTLGFAGSFIWWNDQGAWGHYYSGNAHDTLTKAEGDPYIRSKKIGIVNAALSISQPQPAFVIFQGGIVQSHAMSDSIMPRIEKYIAENAASMPKDLVYGTKVDEYDSPGVRIGLGGNKNKKQGFDKKAAKKK